MTLEEWEKKLDEALEKLDWNNPADKESEAYRVLAAAAADKELDHIADWMKLHDRYWKAVKRL